MLCVVITHTTDAVSTTPRSTTTVPSALVVGLAVGLSVALLGLLALMVAVILLYRYELTFTSHLTQQLLLFSLFMT